MQTEFTKEYILANCYPFTKEELSYFHFMKKDNIQLESIILEAIPIAKKFKFVCHNLKKKEEIPKIALDIAGIVLPIFEEANPEDNRMRDAIAAGRDYQNGRISTQEFGKKTQAAIDACSISREVSPLYAGLSILSALTVAVGFYSEFDKVCEYAADAASARLKRAHTFEYVLTDSIDAAILFRNQLFDYLLKITTPN